MELQGWKKVAKMSAVHTQATSWKKRSPNFQKQVELRFSWRTSGGDEVVEQTA